LTIIFANTFDNCRAQEFLDFVFVWRQKSQQNCTTNWSNWRDKGAINKRIFLVKPMIPNQRFDETTRNFDIGPINSSTYSCCLIDC
jgi:hypothetical protein